MKCVVYTYIQRRMLEIFQLQEETENGQTSVFFTVEGSAKIAVAGIPSHDMEFSGVAVK